MLTANPRVLFRRCLAVLALTGCISGTAHATDDDRIAALEKSIEQLTARVHELEARLAGSPPAAPAAAVAANGSPTDTTERLDTLEHEVSEMAITRAGGQEQSGLPLHGFADVGAGSNNPISPDLEGVSVGSLDFYLTPQLGERTRALFELNFEVADTGEVEVDLERAQLGFQIADPATVWLGRFHTPFGYYNTAFHHGQQISTSLRRPRFIQFEDAGGIMPAHSVGLWLTGAQRTGLGKLTYDVFAGNAQEISDGTLDMNTAGVTNGEAIFGGNFGWLAGGALDGLKLGVSAFTVKVQDDAAVPNLTRVNNYGLYVVYDTDQWENIAEVYLFDDEDLSGATGTHRSEAGFVQVAYRAGRLIPYARYERATLEQADNFFAAQEFGSSYYRGALGLRFDLDLSSALKLEIAETHITERAPDEYGEALMQYAIRF